MNQARARILAGPDEGLEVVLPLGRRVVVGRDVAADVRLIDANVSRRHCTLERVVAGVRIEDLGSKFGTLLGGARLEGVALTSAPVELTLGDTRLWLDPGDGPRLPAVPGLELVRALGDGAGGVVFEGRDAHGRAVAVKLLDPEADERTRRRFEREAALLARLDHPAIAPVLGLTRAADGRPCLVRALALGRTLEGRLEAAGPLPPRDAAALGATIADALAHAHERGVVHRDVKPGNVVLGEDDRAPVLIDFDLARRTPESAATALTRLTETGEGLGTLGYLAPEQLTGAREAGPAADVYGLGATLWHALTGRRPFADVEPEEFFDAVLTRGPGPLARAAPGTPAALAAVVERACAPRPERRFGGAQALARALREAAP